MSAGTAGVRERYAAGGLLGKLTPGSTPAVIVVDLQYGFTDPEFAPGFDLDIVVAATRSLVDTARAHRIPVYFTTIAFPQHDGAAATWLQKMPALSGLRSGHRSTEIDARMGRHEGEPLIVKQAASAFAHTALADLLAEAGIDTVFVAGATTSGCVRATVVDACAANLPAFVVRECVGDREIPPHDASLLDIDAKYGEVVTLEAATTMLAAIAGTTEVAEPHAKGLP
ncbi:isochorismatase family protein [Rhodococcus sp. F64268]|uniref:isochorismatase family protein n=1 Tax=Rhodococcus sp. F64268 TaxID=2926402 RepID=UPI001FF21789|nr:isochorismatase family protein [Rhodococcus sp. F64268]MCK0089456.1 isochorismatase family protein [Rhodococcus sp. F64268]